MPAAPLSRQLDPRRLLGGITPESFLADYWQKKPLLIRRAVADAEKLVTREQLFELAVHEDMQSRLISRASDWSMQYGPFSPGRLKRTRKPWTLLVQGVNLALPAADRLLRHFDFIPYARLDDLMVSYAVDGGGVGPHFDNYDVFLLQGMGQRRWRIGKQRDQTLIDGLPVRILSRFKPSREWVLNPGDMLYLPPGWAHDGVAQGECMTLSIGFRAPPAQELAEQFLSFLQDRLRIAGRYADPNLKRQKHAAEIGAAMIDQVAAMLDDIRWNRSLVAEFLGISLTEPKPHVFFDRPARPLTESVFARKVKRHGLRLDLRSQFLFVGPHFFLNGERFMPDAADRAPLRKLADARALPGSPSTASFGPLTLAALYEAYCSGFIHVAEPERKAS